VPFPLVLCRSDEGASGKVLPALDPTLGDRLERGDVRHLVRAVMVYRLGEGLDDLDELDGGVAVEACAFDELAGLVDDDGTACWGVLVGGYACGCFSSQAISTA
jgi:hypothetical protein